MIYGNVSMVFVDVSEDFIGKIYMVLVCDFGKMIFCFYSKESLGSCVGEKVLFFFCVDD